MITITEPVPAFEPYCEVLGYSPEDSLFFDIETTGFSPRTSCLFLIGTISREGDSWVLKQYLAESAEDEKELLLAFLMDAQQYHTLIHFNGSTFDLPYLIHKAEEFHLPHELDQKKSIDLYQKFRPLKQLLSLDRMNQQSIEAFLQWPRQDRLTGKHMVTLFGTFAASKEPGLRDLLLLHNHDDLVGMTQILSLASYLFFFEGKIETIHEVRVDSPDETSGLCSILEIVFAPALPLPAAFSTENPYHLRADTDAAMLQIPITNGILYHFFDNYKDYYYLPLEDQAVHKSVAAYVDPTYRQKAKASNCYIKKSGAFLPQPQTVIRPAFFTSFEDKTPYFLCSDEFCSDTEHVKTYLQSLLRTFL